MKNQKKIRVAMIGLEHPHIAAFASAIEAFPDDFERIGFADVPGCDDTTDAERIRTIGRHADGVPYFEDWKKLLDEKPDLVTVTTDNRSRGDICCEILSRGIPVLDEKPLAFDLADAVRMKECADAHHTAVLCNWPIAWAASFRKAKELCDAGRIGKVMRVVYRSPATWGPYSYRSDGTMQSMEDKLRTWWYRADRGGGSILDYACYGAMLATWIIGKRPLRVSAVKKNFCAPGSDAEDYSAAILDFGDAVGLLEGSWSTFNPGEIPSGPVIYGTEGVIVCERHDPRRLKLYTSRSHTPVPPEETFELEGIDPSRALGANLRDFIRGIAQPDEMLRADLNCSVVAVLTALSESAHINRTVDVVQP